MAKIYRAIQGDSFDSIAFRLWRDEHLCHELMEANPDYMDVMLFGPGIELNVPQVEKPAKKGSLPPWYGVNNAR